MPTALYIIIFINSIPLIALVAAIIFSWFFSIQTDLVNFATVILSSYQGTNHTVLGNIIVPFVSALSVQLSSKESQMPSQTRNLLIVLATLMMISLLSNGIVLIYKDRIDNFGASTFASLKEIGTTYFNDSLTYLALIFGVSMKKGG